LRDQAEELLVFLLEQREELAARSAESWGADLWETYELHWRMGDDALIANDPAEAVDQYESALETGETLFRRSQEIMTSALAAGDEALALGNSEFAMTQFELVLAVDPDNAPAVRGRERALALPSFLDAMQRGDAADLQGELEMAAAAYREAVQIDRDSVSAQAALDDVLARLAESRFDRLIADGFTALDEGRVDGAIEIFNSAARMRPNSDAVRDGLAQAEQRQLLNSIVLAEVRGSAFERREVWDEAMARYREALAIDPALSFAIEGLERSQYRADLMAKLDALIESPRLLLSDEVLQDARNVLDEALAIEDPGPIHSARTQQLAELVEVASTPIAVTLVSDELTEVTVYRVGELGTFASTELSLKPGQYTAIGSRRGYRDVRQSFTVLPGRRNEPVTVICVEPI
jgi:tetratricopeptide (TPR) repeat protein